MFSVIIPTYNRLNLLKRAVNSVLDQSFKDFEIIIVDDCSTDGTWEWLKSIKDKKIRVYRNNYNSGRSFSRNFGADKSNYDFLCFLDDDDEWLPSHLINFHELFKKHPNLKLAFSGYYKTNGDKKKKAAFSNINTTEQLIILKDFYANNYQDVMMLPSCGVIKKTIFLQNGRFNTNIRNGYGEDIELFTKVALIYKIGFTNRYTVLYFTLSNERKLINNTLISDIIDLNQFKEYEKQNSSLKKWLDLNRFSIARQLKLIKQNNEAKIVLTGISLRNISYIKLLSFNLPYKTFKIINDIYFKYRGV